MNHVTPKKRQFLRFHHFRKASSGIKDIKMCHIRKKSTEGQFLCSNLLKCVRFQTKTFTTFQKRKWKDQDVPETEKRHSKSPLLKYFTTWERRNSNYFVLPRKALLWITNFASVKVWTKKINCVFFSKKSSKCFRV